MFFKRKPQRDAPILHVDDSDFDRKILESEGITVVDFWAAWCGPCRMMEPILDEIALEFEDRGVTIAKLDTEHAPDTAARFEIRSIPTLIFFRDGAPLFQLTGLVPKPVLERELGALLEGE